MRTCSQNLLRLKPKALLIALVLTLCACSQNSSGPFADLVLLSGKIVTVDPEFTIAEGLAIQEGRFAAVGSVSEIRQWIGPETRVLDLEGKSVIPGLIDSHSHPASYGMSLFRPDLSRAQSIQEMMDILKGRLEEVAPGEWVTNSGFWNETKLVDQRNPTRDDLDPISPDHPVYLGRGHLGVLNSKGLEVLGITSRTPDPPGGTFERDSNGRLTGRIYETAIDRVEAVLPEPTRSDLVEALAFSYGEMAAAGVTTVRSAGAGPEVVPALLDLKRRGQLRLRSSVTIKVNPNTPLDEFERFLQETPAASGLGDDWLDIWGIKMVADGGSDLAYLRREYLNRPGFRGQIGASPETFNQIVRLCNQYGWRVGIHALGDAGIDMVLDAYQAAHRDDSISEKRWSIEHGYFLHSEHYPRLKEMGVVLHPQTWHLYNLARNFKENYGSDYLQMSHPYRTILNQGVRMAGGTDWRLEPNTQFFYMWVAISRRDLDDQVVGAAEKLNREEALRLHTIWAAYSMFDEEKTGSIEVGKLADLVVLSQDYLEVPEDEIRNIVPEMTLVGGKIVFEKP